MFGGVFMGVFLCRDYVGNMSYYTLYVQCIVCQLYLNKTAFKKTYSVTSKLTPAKAYALKSPMVPSTAVKT